MGCATRSTFRLESLSIIFPFKRLPWPVSTLVRFCGLDLKVHDKLDPRAIFDMALDKELQSAAWDSPRPSTGGLNSA